MNTHEEFRLATWNPEKDCYIQESMESDWIQTFYSEAIIKVKETSMRFKNISPSKALFKNEINNEHTPALLYINPSFTDWVQNVLRAWNFLEQFSLVLSNNLTNFSICSLKSHWHKIITIQHIYCFLCMVFFFNPNGPFCTLGRCSVCPKFKDTKTDWKCCQCSEWVCKDHSIKTIQIKCDICKAQSY